MAQLTQQELADKVQISQPKISQLESGVIKVSHFVLSEIAQVLSFPQEPLKLIDHCSVEQMYGNSKNS